MIECKHKWPMVVTNRGLHTFHCNLHGISVNDDICSNCNDCEGKMLVPIKEFDFPRRTDEEIKIIYDICKGCPLLNAKTKICKSMHPEFHPTDVVAQHPSNHCPEKKW